MAEDLLAQGRLLEDAFFRKRDQERIAALRKRDTEAQRRQALSEASGITDTALLDQLIAHNLRAEDVAGLALVPIIEMAWADGEVQPDERQAVLAAVERYGVDRAGAAFSLVEEWLDHRPGPKLFELWQNYVRALLPSLSVDARQNLKDTLLQHAQEVAESAGGFLGIGRISANERKMLADLGKAFDLRPI